MAPAILTDQKTILCFLSLSFVCLRPNDKFKQTRLAAEMDKPMIRNLEFKKYRDPYLEKGHGIWNTFLALEVTLAPLIPEVVIVEVGQCGVSQLGELGSSPRPASLVALVRGGLTFVTKKWVFFKASLR